MIAPILCLLLGHQSHLVYTLTHGHVSCRRCHRDVERPWKILRPEHQHREQARTAAFWAKVDEPKVPKLRRVR